MYKLEEFDGTPLAGAYAGNRLKKLVMGNRDYNPVSIDIEIGSDGLGGN